MSTRVVTPPAAAAREARPSPSWSAWPPEFTCPSIAPGITHWPRASICSRAAGGVPRPTKAILPLDTATKPSLTMRCAVTRLPVTTRSKSAMVSSTRRSPRIAYYSLWHPQSQPPWSDCLTVTVNVRSDINLTTLHRVAWQGEKVRIGDAALARIASSRASFLELIDKDPAVVIYGVTTAMGERASHRLAPEERGQHARLKPFAAATSFGDNLPDRTVRGIVFA